VEADEALDLPLLSTRLVDVVGKWGRDALLAFESGRFLAGPAGALVCRVVEVKFVDGRRFVLLDGGTNVCGLFSGTGSMKGFRLTTLRDGEVVEGGEPSHLCGPLCTPMDRLASSVPSAAAPGDIVIWWNTGAYGRTAAPTGFLSFDPPREIVLNALPSLPPASWGPGGPG
jgi:diaminopimelate decarboxylase